VFDLLIQEEVHMHLLIQEILLVEFHIQSPHLNNNQPKDNNLVGDVVAEEDSDVRFFVVRIPLAVLRVDRQRQTARGLYHFTPLASLTILDRS
jgi:hypothetical protein